MGRRPAGRAVAIVGLGIGGSALALLLARAGWRVTVLERAPEPGPVGAGVLIHPSGERALTALGLRDAVLADAEAVAELVALHPDRRPLSRIRYAAGGAGRGGWGVARGALFAPLVRACREAGVAIVAGAEVVATRSDAAGRTLRDAAGREHGPFPLVVAADGGRSTLRTLGRGLGVRVREYRHAALWWSGPCPGIRGRLHQVVDGTRRLLGVVPTGGGRASLFWGVRRDRWDAVRAAGFAALRDEIAALEPATAELLAAAADAGAGDGFTGATFAVYRRVWARRWLAAEGDLVLLGDAAHAMSPHLGQGANLALGDAVALAARLARAGDPAAACRAYARERRPVARRYALLSWFLAPFFQSELPGLALGRDLALPLGQRLPGVEALMARTLAGV